MKFMPERGPQVIFMILCFSHISFQQSHILLSDGAGDVTEYHVLRRQRSHVFLTLHFAQREDRDGSPFIRGLCSAQAGEQNLRR